MMKNKDETIWAERPFLWLLYQAMLICNFGREAEGNDAVKAIQMAMRVQAIDENFLSLIEKWEADTKISLPGYPPYSDVVLGLYELLTRSWVSRENQDLIWLIFARCCNHNFHQFIRLVNPRHNPNGHSRQKAEAVLADIASGNYSRWLNLSQNHNWQKGAKRRLEQLANTRENNFDRNRERTLKIFLVEDTAKFRKMITNALKETFGKALVVKRALFNQDWSGILKQMKNFKPQVIISDLNLEGIVPDAGLRIERELEKINPENSPKLIICSQEEKPKTEAFFCGKDTKGIFIQKLVQEIQAEFERRR